MSIVALDVVPTAPITQIISFHHMIEIPVKKKKGIAAKGNLKKNHSKKFQIW